MDVTAPILRAEAASRDTTLLLPTSSPEGDSASTRERVSARISFCRREKWSRSVFTWSRAINLKSDAWFFRRYDRSLRSDLHHGLNDVFLPVARAGRNVARQSKSR